MSELRSAVALVSCQLEHALRAAASLSHGRDGASLSVRRLLSGFVEEAIDAVALEKDAPERAARSLVRAAVVEVTGRARLLPLGVDGLLIVALGHYIIRSSTRNMALFEFRLHTTRAGLQHFDEEGRAGLAEAIERR